MNAALQSKIAKAQRKVQGMWGEPITFGPVGGAPITSLLSRETTTQRFEEGKGIKEVVQINASVLVGDLSAAPFIGQEAQARGRSWRIFNVNPTPTTFEVTLESPTK